MPRQTATILPMRRPGPNVSMRWPDDLLEAATAAATARGVSLSCWLRMLAALESGFPPDPDDLAAWERGATPVDELDEGPAAE